jgi:hypothetical protein
MVTSDIPGLNWRRASIENAKDIVAGGPSPAAWAETILRLERACRR